MTLPRPGDIPKGLSLVELIIVMTILGAVMSMGLFKITSDSDASRQRAILKESLSKLSEAFQASIRQGLLSESTSDQQVGNILLGQLNVAKLCTHPQTNGGVTMVEAGCYDLSMSPWTFWPNESAGAVLHNGAIVWVRSWHLYEFIEVNIDANGLAGPNEQGKDQLFLRGCLRPGGDGVCPTNGSGTNRLGSLSPSWNIDATGNRQLYESLFR